MKILKWTFAGIAAVLVLGAGVIYGYLRMTVPDYAGMLSAPGLSDEVEVLRDSFGMAHIYAASDRDAYFAMGFCQAQDRLFQMDLARRAGHGRLAEILGEKPVKVDKLFRT